MNRLALDHKLLSLAALAASPTPALTGTGTVCVQGSRASRVSSQMVLFPVNPGTDIEGDAPQGQIPNYQQLQWNMGRSI